MNVAYAISKIENTIPAPNKIKSKLGLSSSFSNNYTDSIENIYVSSSITNVEQAAFSGLYGKGITILLLL